MGIELGNTVRDKYTGFQGMVTGRAEYISGHVSFQVETTVMNDGKPVTEWIASERLEVVDLRVS